MFSPISKEVKKLALGNFPFYKSGFFVLSGNAHTTHGFPVCYKKGYYHRYMTWPNHKKTFAKKDFLSSKRGGCKFFLATPFFPHIQTVFGAPEKEEKKTFLPPFVCRPDDSFSPPPFFLGNRNPLFLDKFAFPTLLSPPFFNLKGGERV